MNPWQNPIIRILTEQVREIIEKLKDEKVSLEGKKELKIHIDPWDAYYFLDSLYFMKLLITKVFFKKILLKFDCSDFSHQ